MSQLVKVSEKFGANVNPIQVLNTMVDAANKWVTEAQQAKTARAETDAWKQVQLDKIRAQQKVLLRALELTFDERREIFRGLFDGLDSAMAARDSAQAASFLESITDLAKTSPFKELANVEITVAELKQPGHVWNV